VLNVTRVAPRYGAPPACTAQLVYQRLPNTGEERWASGDAVRYGDCWNMMSTAFCTVVAVISPFNSPVAAPAHAALICFDSGLTDSVGTMVTSSVPRPYPVTPTVGYHG